LKKAAAEGDYLLEEIDLQNDSVVGKVVISTHRGSFTAR